MAATAFIRRFVAGNPGSYDDGMDIIDAALGGHQDAEMFVLHCAQSRHNPQTRRDMDDIRIARASMETHWLRPLASSIYMLFVTYRKLVLPLWKADRNPSLRNLTKEQHKAFAGTGLVPARKDPLYKKAKEMIDDLQLSLSGHPVVLWVDNYNKNRWGKNPGEQRSQGINGTVFAAMELPVRPSVFGGYLSFKQLFMKKDAAVSGLDDCKRTFSTLLLRLRRERLKFDDVRVPLDIRRDGVYSPVWHPYDVIPDNVCETGGLVNVLQHVDRIHEETGATSIAVMCDQNVYYRIFKILYGRTYMSINFRNYLSKTPLLHGMWHSYKMVVRAMYNRFLPMMVWFEEGAAYHANPEQAKIYQNIDLVVMERVILAVFLISDEQKGILKRNIDAYRNKTDPVILDRLRNLEALYVLLREYIPMAFILGRMVRNCNWGKSQNYTARECHDFNRLCLLMLLRLRGNANPKDFQAYIDTLCLVVLSWSDFHTTLPGNAFGEEHLEAMLSRLSRALGRDLTANNIQAYVAHFVTLGPSTDGATSQDLSKAGMACDLHVKMEVRMEALINSIKRDDFPYIAYTSNKKARVSGQYNWPLHHSFPGALDQIEKKDIDAAFCRAIKNVSNPRKLNKGTTQADINRDIDSVRGLCGEAGQLSDEQLAARQMAYEAFDNIMERDYPPPEPAPRRRPRDGSEDEVRPRRRRAEPPVPQRPREINVLTGDSEPDVIPLVEEEFIEENFA